jgi:hypothetical protein
VRRTTKKLHLLPHKITQVQRIYEGHYKGIHFYNWFLLIVHMVLKTTVSTDEALLYMSMLRTKTTATVLIQVRLLKYPFTVRGLVYSMSLLLHK